MPLTMVEVQPAHDYMMSLFDKCIVNRMPNRDAEGEYEVIRVHPTTELYGGNHKQGLLSFRENGIPVGQESEYVNWSGSADAFKMCYHLDPPDVTKPCPRESGPDRTYLTDEDIALRELRSTVRVQASGRMPRTVVLPVAQRLRPTQPSEELAESVIETITWEPHYVPLRDVIVYQASYNGMRYGYEFTMEGWIHTTDAGVMRLLRDHTAGILGNQDR